MRFSNFLDAQRAVRRLNEFVIMGKRIGMKMPRFKGRREIWRKVNMLRNSLISKEANQDGMIGENKEKVIEGEEGETQEVNTTVSRPGDKLNLKEMNHQKAIAGHVENEQLLKLQKCLVGEVAAFCEINNLVNRISWMGLGVISVKRIQGNHFLVEIPGRISRNSETKKWSYLKEFFIHIESWLRRGFGGKGYHGSKYLVSPCITGTMKPLKELLV